MIEIVNNDSREIARQIADEIRKISRAIMITEKVHDLFSGRVVDVSVTDNGPKLLFYDQFVITTEIRVSNKDPMIIRITIISNLAEPLDDIVFSIGYGSLGFLESNALMEVTKTTHMIQSVYQSYRKVLMEALRELAS